MVKWEKDVKRGKLRRTSGKTGDKRDVVLKKKGKNSYKIFGMGKNSYPGRIYIPGFF